MKTKMAFVFCVLVFALCITSCSKAPSVEDDPYRGGNGSPITKDVGKIVLKKDGVKYAKLKAWKHEQDIVVRPLTNIIATEEQLASINYHGILPAPEDRVPATKEYFFEREVEKHKDIREAEYSYMAKWKDDLADKEARDYESLFSPGVDVVSHYADILHRYQTHFEPQLSEAEFLRFEGMDFILPGGNRRLNELANVNAHSVIYKDVELSEPLLTLNGNETLFVQEIDKIGYSKNDPRKDDACDIQYVYKVSLDNQTGYMRCVCNPYDCIYNPDLWKIEDIIESGDKTWTVRNYKSVLEVTPDPNRFEDLESFAIYEKPGITSKIVQAFDSERFREFSGFYEVLAITEEIETQTISGWYLATRGYDYDSLEYHEPWIKIRTNDGMEGWIFGAYVKLPSYAASFSLDKYITPEDIVANEFYGKFLIGESGYIKPIEVYGAAQISGAEFAKLMGEEEDSAMFVKVYKLPSESVDESDKILDILYKAHIAYTVDEEGFLLVKDDKTARKALTLIIANRPTPANTRNTWDTWDLYDFAWTTTEFERREKERSNILNSVKEQIESLAGISVVDVSITYPEETIFGQVPASSSVKLSFSSYDDLLPELDTEVVLKAVRNILLYSVAGLEEKNIKIIDSLDKQ